MQTLEIIDPITDYGEAGALPVFGGNLNLRSMAKLAVHAIRDR